MKNFNVEMFLSELELNFNKNFLTPQNGVGYWNSFEAALTQVVNKHAPQRLRSRKEKKLFKKPWLTKDIIKSIKIRD